MNNNISVFNNKIEVRLYGGAHNRICDFLKRGGWKYNKSRCCWQNNNTEFNQVFAELIIYSYSCRKNPSSDKIDNYNEIIKEDRVYNNTISLSHKNTLNIVDSYLRHHKHTYKEYNAEISVCDVSGVFSVWSGLILYCETCNKYYITRSCYQNICQIGVPYVVIKSRNQTNKLLLNMMGYNISLNNLLSEKQRCTLLYNLYINDFISKDKILLELTQLYSSCTEELIKKILREDIAFVKTL